MQKSIFISMLSIVLSLGLYGQNSFTLQSETLGGNATSEHEFNGFGCTGDNVSPPLSWSDAPDGTKSFAITMYDPDAPTGSGWWHWVVFDIAKDVSNIIENAGNIEMKLMPDNTTQSITNYGVAGYGGPCPPENHGIHQYVITVHALDVDKLGLDESTNPAIVGYYIWSHTIAKASIVTYYERK